MASMLLCFTFLACTKDDDTRTNNGGGTGTVINDDNTGIELNLSNSGNDIISFTTNYVDNYGSINTAVCLLKMTSSNNFVLESNFSAWLDYDIASVGQVSGLSSIYNIPTAGWVKQIAVSPGAGYVVRYKGNAFGYTYARIYVKDWMVNTDGGIMGATVIYQDWWGMVESSNALFGTTWYYSEQVSDGGVEYSSSLTVQFSNTTYTGTLRVSRIFSTGEIDNDVTNFIYTYGENGIGEMVIVYNNGYGEYYTESLQFMVEGNTMTLSSTEVGTGATYTVAVLTMQ